MKLFTELYEAIDETTRTNAKVAAMVSYFRQVPELDLLYAIALLIGTRPKRPVKTAELKLWAAELAGIPYWLFEESYHIVGDLGETIALVLPPATAHQPPSLHQVWEELLQWSTFDADQRRKAITHYWQSLTRSQRFVFTKLITGNFRMGVSRQLVIKALAIVFETDEAHIAHQLMGKWDPQVETKASLFSDHEQHYKHHQPYPFFLAYPLALATEASDKIENAFQETLGAIEDWILEPKLDGIRGQLILRQGDLFVWSRGEDLLTDKFPEFNLLRDLLPDGTVIDGEIIPFKEGKFLTFNEMQTRIGRKNLSRKILTDVPLVMVCYDLLEWQGTDIRSLPLSERRALLIKLLETIPTQQTLLLSADLKFANWSDAAHFRSHSRQQQCEGLMIKRRSSPYETGRKRGNWWKWKTNPMTIDGVLIYAQSGHGRRANLFTDYTFAVWDEEGKLLPFAKAYSGLTDKEIVELDRWIKRHTIEKFGPVRSVSPFWVFEIAFEGIAASPRHKSGIALRFPRILRWRRDKSASEANTLNELKTWLPAHEN